MDALKAVWKQVDNKTWQLDLTAEVVFKRSFRAFLVHNVKHNCAKVHQLAQ